MEPVFTRSLSPDAYACRPGYGTHRAVLRLLEHIRKHRVLIHLDIKSYFPSVDLEVLRCLLRRRIRDEAFLAVVDRVLAAGSGIYDAPQAGLARALLLTGRLPAAACRSGPTPAKLFAAHVYLGELDHFVKRGALQGPRVSPLCR